MPDLTLVDPRERLLLGEAWLLAARMEHASIAAFSQLSLHLAALGAPDDLVERTHLAALDEVRHAKRCFAFARAYASRSWTAGPLAELATSARATEPVTLERLACGSLVDGCLAEGLASDVARRGAMTAVDPVIRTALQMIAADEHAHAELAWDVLGWCLERGGRETRRAIEQRLAVLSAELSPRLPEVPGVSADRLETHGIVRQDALELLATDRVDVTLRRARALLYDGQSAAA
jgi:hypothetical protein